MCELRNCGAADLAFVCRVDEINDFMSLLSNFSHDSCGIYHWTAITCGL